MASAVRLMLCAWQAACFSWVILATWQQLHIWCVHGNGWCFSWVILAAQQQLHVWYCVHSNSCRLELSDIGYIATTACLVLCAQQQRYALDRWYWLHGNGRMFDVVCMATAACFSWVYWLHSNGCMFDFVCMATAAYFSWVILVA